MMNKVAVTGNIGSGKSTVCKIFESLGIEVYYADGEAKKFYRDLDVIRSVKEVFGNDIFDEHGIISHTKLATIVFNNEELLKKLNGIIHPLVLKDFQTWAGERGSEDYIVYESALLFESGFNKYFDHSILVTAPTEIAMNRVMERDKISRSDFEARLSRQMPEPDKQALARHIIINDGTTALIPQVIEMHKQILKG